MSGLGLIKKPRFMLLPFRFRSPKNPLPKSKLPRIRTKHLPGPKSQKCIESLKRFECPQITYVGDSFPVFFKEARACNLFDVDGNRYLDLAAGFGVMGAGHGSRPVIEALTRQAKRMIHGLGDVHPHELKVQLAQKLAEITPGNLSQSIFSSTGAEAVESALKTACIATKKSGVLAFEGAYHGLTLGTLAVTHREHFRKPFLKQTGGFAAFAPFPDARLFGSQAASAAMKAVERLWRRSRKSKHPVGAVILEPVQGRGGVRVMPPDFLKSLRAFCDEKKILMIADEVFTGFGRTGAMFAVEKSGVVPDLLCVGKAMGGGFPVSACVGSAHLMHAWGASSGDAVHTSTFLGHPLGAAMALAAIREIEEKRFVDRARQLGDYFRKELWKIKEKHPLLEDVRGAGLMIGIEFCETAPRAKKPLPAADKARRFAAECLRRGIVLLTDGMHGNVVTITPPFVITEREIDFCIKAFDKILEKGLTP